MHLIGSHQSVSARLRLTLRPGLGAGNFFRHACDVTRDRDRPILFRTGSDGLRGLSLTQLRSQVHRYANWHQDRGVTPGARVGVYTEDGLLGLVHHIAITSLGGVTVLTNPNMAVDVAAHYLARTGATSVVADLARAEALRVVDAPDLPGRTVTTDDVDREADREDQPSGGPYRHAADDLVLISHSSGTTGTPKPTEFAHRSFFVGKRERLWSFASATSDRMLTALPHSHSSGISYLSLALLLGLPTLMIDERSGDAVAAAMNAFDPTVVIGFPISFAELNIDDLSPHACRTVHTFMGMGDASHERHIRPLVDLGATYVDGLGSSEMGMVLFKHAHGPGTDSYGRIIGRPVRVVRDAAVLDEHGNRLSPGQPGLLGVRTPSVTPGYVNEPDLTEQARSGGYFLTGDVVRREPDGTWYHLDRTPDVIRTAGGPVHSLPIEEVVLTVTGALDAGVVAVDDPDEPGRSRAVAVLFHPGQILDPQDTLARCNAELGRRGLAALAAMVVAADRDGLPVGVTGKVLKRVLRERHRGMLTDPSDSATGVAVRAGAGE